MKSIKVFYLGKPLRQVYPFATKWQVFKWKLGRFMRKLIISLLAITVFSWILVGAYYAGSQLNPKTVYAEKEVQVPVETEIPILDKIIQCESGGSHLSKNGQVLIKVNSNGTTDVGIAQIISVWFPIATKMGYDLTKEADNKAFAKWLLLTKGSEPWYSSKSCWSK